MAQYTHPRDPRTGLVKRPGVAVGHLRQKGDALGRVADRASRWWEICNKWSSHSSPKHGGGGRVLSKRHGPPAVATGQNLQ